MICKAESETVAILPSRSFWHPSLALSLPHLLGYTLLWKTVGPPKLHPPLVMSNLKFKPLETGFYTLNFSDGLPKKRGLRISPLKPHLENQIYGQTSSLGMLLLSVRQPALKSRRFGVGQWKSADPVSWGFYLVVQGF